MATTRTSAVITLTIEVPGAFTFGTWSNITLVQGQTTTQSQQYSQGNPDVGNSALDAVTIAFYQDSAGSNARTATETIGETGGQRQLNQIVTVAHAAPNFTVTVDAASGLDIGSTDQVIYFALSVVQPDPGD